MGAPPRLWLTPNSEGAEQTAPWAGALVEGSNPQAASALISGSGMPIGTTDAVFGSVVAPVATSGIVVTPALAAGFYDFLVNFSYGAVGDVASNVEFYINGVGGYRLITPAAANTPMQATRFPRVWVPAGQTVAIDAIAAGAAGSVYNGQLIWTQVQ